MTDAIIPAKTLTRRALLDGATRLGGAAATLAAARALLPAGAWAAGPGPEVTKAIFGYIALTDSSPLIIAKEKGLFAKYGMPDVDVAKQASWGTTRDNLELGSASGGIDGAHILSPMPYLMHTGRITKNNVPVPMTVLARLNINGQAISVAEEYKALKVTTKADGLREEFAKRKAAGKEVKVAMTFRGGTHDLWVRYWLAANGIDPDKDLSTIVVPPPQMVANMKVGSMDVFCVGEPWNAQLVNQKIGFTACTTEEIWKGHPEKALAMRADWVEKHPNAAKAVLMALQEAQQWCEKMENKEELAAIVGKRAWFNVPPADIVGRLKGEVDYGDGRKLAANPDRMKFWADHASFPFPSHDLWFVTEDVRWGILPANTDLKKLVAEVNRADIWRAAAKEIGAAAPDSDSRGKETFFDGKIFDPADPAAYLASLAVKRV